MTVKSCEKLEKSQVALTIEVGAAEFETAVEKAYQKMRRKINVPGFRPGKAPRKMIERMYGAEVFFEEAINIAFPEAYEAAVEQEKLQVVGYPAVEMVGEVTKDGFTFKATAPVYPEVTLGEYKGLKAEKPEVKVTAADVDERLKTLADRNTRLVSVDREAKSGDTAVIDFEGFLNGKPFEGGKGENHNLELGSGSFVPGFEDQVIGMKAGEEKDIDITFPENYHEDLAGKAVVFKVKVHEVKETVVPEKDDEFVKDVSEFDTVAELRADIEKRIRDEKQAGIDRAFENAAVEKAAANMTVEIPDSMIDEELDQEMERMDYELRSQGASLQAYAQMMGGDMKTMRNAFRPAAEKQAKINVTLAKIEEVESIDATEDEVNAEYDELAKQYSLENEKVRSMVPEEEIKAGIKSRKAKAVITESAVAVAPKVEEPKIEEAKTEE